MKNTGQWRLFLIAAACLVLGINPRTVQGENNIQRATELEMSFEKEPEYTGKPAAAEDFIDLHLFTDLNSEDRTEVAIDDTIRQNIRYYYYRYRAERPNGPDEKYDLLAWNELPTQVGTYWMKVTFLGDNNYKLSTTGIYQFHILPARPDLHLYTTMTEETKIGDSIAVTAEFLGVSGEETIHPAGKAVFQSINASGEDTFIGTSVPFIGNKAEVSYVLPAESVTLTVDYVPDEKADNYSGATASLENIQGGRREQSPLVIAGGSVAYGADPYRLPVTVPEADSSSGALHYASSKPEIARINEKGIVTVKHPGTTKITVTKDGDDTYLPTTAVYKLKVTKGKNPEKPKVPVLLEVTENSITVKQTRNHEYSIDGGKTWNKKGVFKNLEARTMYTVISRLVETKLYKPGSVTKFLQVTTASALSGGANGDHSGGESGADDSGGSGSQASGRQTQWRTLSGAAAGSGSDSSDSREKASSGQQDKEDKEITSTKKERENASGSMKGSRSDEAEDPDGKEHGAAEESEKDTEENGTAEEAAEEETENRIVATGSVRPVKQGISPAAVVGIVISCTAVFSGTLLYVRLKRRRIAE